VHDGGNGGFSFEPMSDFVGPYSVLRRKLTLLGRKFLDIAKVCSRNFSCQKRKSTKYCLIGEANWIGGGQ
jgi:hypothetical protein